MVYTSDNEYVEKEMKDWEKLKKETRKKLPTIYEKASEEIKTIISMLVESEYEVAIRQDNEIRRNANARGERTTMDTNADNYKKENTKIMEMIEAK